MTTTIIPRKICFLMSNIINTFNDGGQHRLPRCTALVCSRKVALSRVTPVFLVHYSNKVLPTNSLTLVLPLNTRRCEIILSK